MKPAGLATGQIVAAASLFDPELLAMYAVLLTFLVSGGIVIYGTYRWYRNLKNASSSKNDDLDQLARALENGAELAPDEKERVRAALQRQKDGDVQRPPE